MSLKRTKAKSLIYKGLHLISLKIIATFILMSFSCRLIVVVYKTLYTNTYILLND